MRKFLLCLFWNTYYLFRKQPQDLDNFLKIHGRTRWPWWKFKPFVNHNDDGRCWEVYFKEDGSYTVSGIMIQVDLHADMKNGKVVGFNITDRELSYLGIEVARLQRRVTKQKEGKENGEDKATTN